MGPLAAYGASQAAGEFLNRRRHGSRHWIVRTSGVFGAAGTSNEGYTLIERVLQQAERGEETRMVADMTFSPSYAPHVARVRVTYGESGVAPLPPWPAALDEYLGVRRARRLGAARSR